MSKSTGKTPQKQEPNRPAAKEVIDENDFSGSMARLAELAAAGLGSDTKKSEEKDLEQEALNQYLTPKRKKKSAAGEKEDQESKPGTIKFRVNPYVVSGMLVVVLSLGVLAIPKIVKFIDTEEKPEVVDQKKLAAQESARKEAETKSYTVGDAIRDVTQKGELRTSSVEDLAKQVAETNVELGLPEDNSRFFGLFHSEDSDTEVVTEENDSVESDTASYHEVADTPEENSSNVETPLARSDELSVQLATLPTFTIKANTCYSADEILTEEGTDRFFWDLFRSVRAPKACNPL